MDRDRRSRGGAHDPRWRERGHREGQVSSGRQRGRLEVDLGFASVRRGRCDERDGVVRLRFSDDDGRRDGRERGAGGERPGVLAIPERWIEPWQTGPSRPRGVGDACPEGESDIERKRNRPIYRLGARIRDRDVIRPRLVVEEGRARMIDRRRHADGREDVDGCPGGVVRRVGV